MIIIYCCDCSYSFVINPDVCKTLVKNHGHKVEFYKKIVYTIA